MTPSELWQSLLFPAFFFSLFLHRCLWPDREEALHMCQFVIVGPSSQGWVHGRIFPSLSHVLSLSLSFFVWLLLFFFFSLSSINEYGQPLHIAVELLLLVHRQKWLHFDRQRHLAPFPLHLLPSEWQSSGLARTSSPSTMKEGRQKGKRPFWHAQRDAELRTPHCASSTSLSQRPTRLALCSCWAVREIRKFTDTLLP